MPLSFDYICSVKQIEFSCMNSGSEAYERILKAIVTSELKPGDTVAEIQLAERFGFGRTPVREAIMRLENEGFIVSSERKKRVYILFAQDIENIFSIKQAIECMVSRKAAVFAEEDDKRELVSVIEEMKRSIPEKDRSMTLLYRTGWLWMLDFIVFYSKWPGITGLKI